MIDLLPGSMSSLLAAADSATLTVREFDWPATPLGWMLLLGGGAVVLLWTVWFYLKDTADLSWFWKVWLTSLRLASLAALLVIALNPSDRTQKQSCRYFSVDEAPSRFSTRRKFRRDIDRAIPSGGHQSATG
jgi:hypothetical protein